MSQYQTYRYVHYCPNISPSNTQQSATVSVPDLLIRHSPLLPQCLSCWYPAVHHCLSARLIDTTVHYCPSTSITDMLQYTVPLPGLLIRYIVYHCPHTSPTDMLKYTSALVSVLLITYSHILSQYQTYWYPTVDYCPTTNPTNTIQSQ